MLVRNSRLLQELEADVCRCPTTGRFLSKPYAMSICIPDWETAKRSRPGLEHFLVAGMDYGNVDFNFQLFDGGPSNGRNHFLLVYDPNMIILFFFCKLLQGISDLPTFHTLSPNLHSKNRLASSPRAQNAEKVL